MKTLFTAVITLIYINSAAQINQSWRQNDINLINQVAILDKQNPSQIQKFFSEKGYKEHDVLGFGWEQTSFSIGAGYISIRAKVFCSHDTIKSYYLEAYLPDEVELAKEYKTLYSKIFPTHLDDKYYFNYHTEIISQPLQQFYFLNLPLKVTPKIADYMSPFSGIEYGYRGGFSGGLLFNRELFMGIQKEITNNQIIAVMFSVNPASRLTAIEFYLSHKNRFKISNEIDSWIETVYKELPSIQTLDGCIQHEVDAKERVQEYVKTKNEN